MSLKQTKREIKRNIIHTFSSREELLQFKSCCEGCFMNHRVCIAEANQRKRKLEY